MAAAATCLHFIDVPKDLADTSYLSRGIHCCALRAWVVLIHRDGIDLKSNDDTVEAGPLLTIFNISNSLLDRLCWTKLIFAGKAGSEKAIERRPGGCRNVLDLLAFGHEGLCFFSLASPNWVRLG